MQLLSITKNKFLIYSALTLIIFISLYSGFKWSLYNQDYHHSFFILSAYVDYQNGLEYFKDIFLQYGPGQVILFHLIDYFIDINIVSISNLNVVVYSLNLLILFKIFEKISTLQIAILATLIIFLIHPYSIYPWPDYLSGCCLVLFFFFFLNKDNKLNIFLCSSFLFLAIFFRSTYIINILFSIFLYSSILFFFKKKNIINIIAILLFFFITIYFGILVYFENLSLWYLQSIGVITSYAEYTSYPDLYNKIIQYVGREGFIFFKIGYYALRSLGKLLDLTNVSNFAFILCIFVNLFFIFRALKKKIQINHEEKKILFVSILGLSGFIQSFMLFEVFRNINATIGIFITLIYLYKNKDISISFFNKHSKKTLLVISIYLIILVIKFPYQNYNDKDYTNFNNSYFSDSKKVKLSIKKYYEELSDYICEIDDISIINDTADNAIPYLCDNRFIKSKISIDPLFLKIINPSAYKRVIIEKILTKNEIYLKELEINKGEISYRTAPNTNMKLLKVIKSGHNNPYLYGDVHIHGIKK
jgi:hypothetical protein